MIRAETWISFCSQCSWFSILQTQTEIYKMGSPALRPFNYRLSWGLQVVGSRLWDFPSYTIIFVCVCVCVYGCTSIGSTLWKTLIQLCLLIFSSFPDLLTWEYTNIQMDLFSSLSTPVPLQVHLASCFKFYLFTDNTHTYISSSKLSYLGFRLTLPGCLTCLPIS